MLIVLPFERADALCDDVSAAAAATTTSARTTPKALIRTIDPPY
jgi:hypothetical protein